MGRSANEVADISADIRIADRRLCSSGELAGRADIEANIWGCSQTNGGFGDQAHGQTDDQANLQVDR